MIQRFPMRHAACVWVLREYDAWLVLAREYGWLHADCADAHADAQWLSANLQLPIRFREEAA
jgi:hypothetical protein